MRPSSQQLATAEVSSLLLDNIRSSRQVVVLFQILAAEINFGYKFQTVQCVSFNGAGLRNIRQLAELVRSPSMTRAEPGPDVLALMLQVSRMHAACRYPVRRLAGVWRGLTHCHAPWHHVNAQLP